MFENRKIYFNENLTAMDKELHYQVRMKAKEKKYQYVWSKCGVSYVRKTTGDKAIRIVSFSDLDNIR